MCLKGPKKPQAPAPAPPPPSEDDVPSPVIGDGFDSAKTLAAKRKGKGSLKNALSIPTGGSGTIVA